jgi:glycosyltransferase involved in cell wall biosynthesis
MTPKVSVIIATLNRGHLLGAAIESILGQTYDDYEIIVADDGSTDDTADVVKKYSEVAGPGRIRYLYQDHQGKSVALNAAAERARGSWIAFLDSDDVWVKDKLERQFRALAEYPECGVCFTDCQFANNPQMEMTAFELAGRSYSGEFLKIESPREYLLETPCALIITLLCRSDLYRNSGGFDPALSFTEDYDFTFRIAGLTEFCFVNQALAIADRSPVRHTGKSTIWDKVGFRLQCEQYRFEKWLSGSMQLTPVIRRTIREKLRAVHSSWANLHLASGHYAAAVQSIRKAIRYQLTPNLLLKLILTCLCPFGMRYLALKRPFDTSHF